MAARKYLALCFPARGALKPYAWARLLSGGGRAPEEWREAVADKTAAMDERITGAVAVMNLNKDIMEKAVEKAVGGVKADMGELKADLKEAMKQEMASMKKVLRAELGASATVIKGVERLFYIAVISPF